MVKGGRERGWKRRKKYQEGGRRGTLPQSFIKVVAYGVWIMVLEQTGQLGGHQKSQKKWYSSIDHT